MILMLPNGEVDMLGKTMNERKIFLGIVGKVNELVAEVNKISVLIKSDCTESTINDDTKQDDYI